MIHLSTQLGSRMPWDVGAVVVAALHSGASLACVRSRVSNLGSRCKGVWACAQRKGALKLGLRGAR